MILTFGNVDKMLAESGSVCKNKLYIIYVVDIKSNLLKNVVTLLNLGCWNLPSQCEWDRGKWRPTIM